jgi:ABC-type transporter Mla subunit MlaD
MNTAYRNSLLLAGAMALAMLAALIYEATAPLVGTLRNIELASSRTAALIGDVEKAKDGQPATIARLVATTDSLLATANVTVGAVQPVLDESARTVKAVRPVLDESAKTVQAVRPVLEAATSAVKRGEESIVQVRGQITPVIDHARSILFQVDDVLPDFLDCGDANRNCIFNRWAGISWQTEQTLRAIATSANRVEKAVPNFLGTWDRIGKNSDKTTQATAEVMGNFAAATKPLPTWMRLGLSIAPPVVQVGATVVTTMAIRGKHK